MSFLTAEWRKLCFANYEVPPELLQSYVPAHTQLDFFDGKCYVSLVGFLFDKVRLKGVTVPFHTRFEEINLRSYVKRKVNGQDRRGTVFISEVVRKPAIVAVANLLYNEKYSLRKMHWHHHLSTTENVISYALKEKNKWMQIELMTDSAPKPYPACRQARREGGKTEFITQHYWGYSKKNEQQSFEYEVRHPKWEQYEVKSHKIEMDFGSLYGKDFAFLNQKEPDSVQMMEGSPISIEGKRVLPAPSQEGGAAT